MNPPLRLGFRNPLYPVRARLKLESAVHCRSSNPGNNFLVAAVFSIILAEHFNLPVLVLSITAVHSEQVAGKNGRLIATSSSADFQKNVAGIVRVLWQHQPLQIFIQLFTFLPCRLQLLLCHFAHFRITVSGQLFGRLNIIKRGSPGPERMNYGLYFRILPGQIAELVLIGNGGRITEQGADFLEPFCKLFEACLYRWFHSFSWVAGSSASVSSVSRWCSSRSHSVTSVRPSVVALRTCTEG